MNIKYIRNLNASHMVIEQMGDLNEWERHMVAHNSIEGILFAESVKENGVTSLWYDITGKQALETVLENTKLDYRLLCLILIGIYGAVEKLEGLLLQIDDLFLSQESIFIDHQSGAVSFCYYPGNTEKIQVSFSRLVEYLLTKIEHKDENAAALIYALYEQTRKEGYSLFLLLKEIKIPYPKEETVPEISPQWISESSVDDAEEGRIEDSLFDEQKETVVIKQGGLQKIKEIFLDFQIEKILPWTKFGEERRKKGFFKKKAGNTELSEEPFVFEPEPEDTEVTHPTVLLSEISKKIEGVLHYEGKNGHKDMVIDTLPFLIGSDKSCEGYLPSETVSRKHARITKQEDIYFIEDLNSSNGTYVGGELLNYRIRMSLQKDEIILFADEKYRFS